MVFVVYGCLGIDKADGITIVVAGNFALYSSAQSYAYANAGAVIVQIVRIVAS